ncbi:NADP-dependent oxidoreductase [Herbiconiux flava]|uniref:NADPH:quinone reductase-like Zn-dependent oxidoreductase n=1 Tax=Herbiconiux flava TaxID=881268 RepID=A0A852S8W2_9MICO|nr:NADP-dependent oxidoreductase [Herbiconiux flava]NYD69688.1 NADPH:quinone reductase-like Zn-dependent oxidoreductase [Herbiconiux flava]GLK16435.1 putative oxidoreductase [Herbiconiux flava]
MAQQIQYRTLGGPEVLEFVTVPTPVAPHGGVVVETRAIGVNPIDVKLRSGLRPSPPITAPRVPGSDAAGVIVSVAETGAGADAGADAGAWTVGDEVIVRDAAGAYRTHVPASAAQLVAKPAAVGWNEAAGIGIPVGTAYQALRSLGVDAGQTLLVHGGSGAVGQAAIQFARDRGAAAVATASARNLDRLRELGAIAVEYGEGLLERVQDAAPDGIDRVLDAAGTDEALDVSFALVPDRSHIGTIVVGAKADALGIRAWMGGSPHPLTDEEQAWRREAYGVAADLIAAGRFEVEIAAVYPLAEAAAAQRALASGSLRGKLILDPRA